MQTDVDIRMLLLQHAAITQTEQVKTPRRSYYHQLFVNVTFIFTHRKHIVLQRVTDSDMWLQRVWLRPFSLSFHAPYVREHKTIVIENLNVPPALSLPLEARAVLSAPRPLPSYCLLCRRSLAPGAFLWLCRSLLRLQKTPWSLWELAGACVPPDGCVPDKYRGLKQWKSNEVVCKY